MEPPLANIAIFKQAEPCHFSEIFKNGSRGKPFCDFGSNIWVCASGFHDLALAFPP